MSANAHAGPSGTTASSSSTPPPTPTILPDASGRPPLPWAFIDCPTDSLVILISHMLELLIQHNDQVELTPEALTRFHSRAAPGISVIDYLRRIVKYTNMEKIPLLSLLAYIDITCQHHPTFTLSSLTVHRFLISGVCAGSKAQCDVFCTNSHYAKVGGIKVQELNALEREFLRVTQWDLCCHADLLQRYYTSLIKSHGGYSQAEEPATVPFTQFPLHGVKLAPGEADGQEDQDEAMLPDTLEQDADAAGTVNDAALAKASISEPEPDPSLSQETDKSRGRSVRRRTSRTGTTAMDVDANTSANLSPRSDASSSVPSSRSSFKEPTRSRTSLRMSAGALQLSSDKSAAEPHVDRATAVGHSGESSPALRPPTVHPPAAASGNLQPDPSHAATPVPIPSTSARPGLGQTPASSQPRSVPRSLSASHPHDQSQSQSHSHSAHKLRNLVGGLFHRRHPEKSHSFAPDRPASGHTDLKPPPQVQRATSSPPTFKAQAVRDSAARSGLGQPASVAPSRPLPSGPSHPSDMLTPSVAKTLQQSHSYFPLGPPDPGTSVAIDPGSTGAANGTSGNGTRVARTATLPSNQARALRSPKDTTEPISAPNSPRNLRSPGMAKPLTPRIRTRSERSTDGMGERGVVAGQP